MKFRMIALAAMALAGTAQAANILPATIATGIANGTVKEIRIFGASAQSPLIGAAMKSVVCKNATDFTTYFDTTTGSSHRAYACTLAIKYGNYLAGTMVFLNKRDAGGSAFGVNPVAQNTAQNTMVVDGSCAATGQVNPPATVAAYTCSGVTLKTPHAGISDVEPAQFSKVVTIKATPTNLNLPSGNDDNGSPWTVLTTAEQSAMDISAINQTLFGIAVNTNLRNALQTAQGLVSGSDLAENQPSMPRAFYAAAISGFVKGGSANATWKTLTGLPGDEAKQVNICRRVTGSGTQVTSNLFFLEAGVLGSDALGMLAPLTAVGALAPIGTLAVIENSSTSNVETCLTNTTVSNSGGYSMGIVSMEKDPIAGAKAYRFVKIDGAAPTKALARKGGYPYVYSASMQFNTSVMTPLVDQKAFVVKMRTDLGKPAIIATLDAVTKAGVMANPNSYTANCANATGTDLSEGSCVERMDLKSAFNTNTYINGLTAKFKTTSNQALHIVK